MGEIRIFDAKGLFMFWLKWRHERLDRLKIIPQSRSEPCTVENLIYSFSNKRMHYSNLTEIEPNANQISLYGYDLIFWCSWVHKYVMEWGLDTARFFSAVAANLSTPPPIFRKPPKLFLVEFPFKRRTGGWEFARGRCAGFPEGPLVWRFQLWFMFGQTKTVVSKYLKQTA